MKILKRLTTTFTASFDSFVSRVEDHDALIKRSLKDARSASARARVHLKRVSTDNHSMLSELDKICAERDQWAQRALQSSDDENRALACIKRMNLCEQRVEPLQKAIAQRVEMKQRIQQNISQLDQRVETINRQRNTMRSRQSTAEVNRIINDIDDRTSVDLEEVFENWEIQLSESEFSYETPIEVDELESGFVNDEETTSLKHELEALIKAKGAGK
jgi:phage shock protein A